VEPRISLVTLGVTDLERATRFYRDVLKLPQLQTPPEVTFFELGLPCIRDTSWLPMPESQPRGEASLASHSPTTCARQRRSMQSLLRPRRAEPVS
jgi:catechol 2,3-dioxygenase-like lactoylglutathione lyase family enzyme